MPVEAPLVLGTILAVQVINGPSWIPHTRASLLSDTGETIEFLLPGANGGPPAAVLGVPILAPGQRWEIELGSAAIGPVPVGHGLGMRALDPLPIWNINGNHLPEDQLPWPMFLEQRGNEQLGIGETEAIVQAAMDQWSNVACSTFAFEYQGRTELGVEEDGVNVLAWENDSWEWHADAAGMSVVRFDVSSGTPVVSETDILFNAVNWDWDAETGTMGEVPPLLHAGSIIAHELGHTTGMDHEYFYATSTMHLAYYGGSWMATLSGDDMRGLCENYPSGLEGCSGDEDCQDLDISERHCVEIDEIQVCDELRDEVGSACSLDAFNCAEVCVFDTMFYTEGRCALACPEGSCPEGYGCEEASYTIPLQPGPVCLPLPVDTGLETGDTDTDSDPPGDSDEPDEEPESCGCATGRATTLPLLLALGLFAIPRRRASISPPLELP